MTGEMDLTLLIQQLPHLAKVVVAEHGHPEAQKAANTDRARDSQKHRGHQVQKAEEANESKSVKKDDEHHQAKTPFARDAAKDDDLEDATDSASDSPFTGNILDLTI